MFAARLLVGASMQGNCKTQPDSAMVELLGELPPLQVPNQCILVINFMFLYMGNSSLWLDGLLLQSQDHPTKDYELGWANPMIHVFMSVKLWMTGVSLLVRTSCCCCRRTSVAAERRGEFSVMTQLRSDSVLRLSLRGDTCYPAYALTLTS